MLTSMQLVLERPGEGYLNPHFGSLLHGAMMQRLNPDYATLLHDNSLKPYSQYIYFDRATKQHIWKVNTITDESRQQILNALKTSINGKVHIEHKNLDLIVKEKKFSEPVSYKDISEEYYLKKPFKRKIIINFLTPTSFKSNGRYMIFPEIPQIYNSLLKKWNAFAVDISLEDKDMLNHLIEHTEVSGYNLRSTCFDLENTKVSSFKGEICLYVRGPESLVRIANLLFAFGEYSGVGVKCALGMGGIRVE